MALDKFCVFLFLSTFETILEIDFFCNLLIFFSSIQNSCSINTLVSCPLTFTVCLFTGYKGFKRHSPFYEDLKAPSFFWDQHILK